MTLGVPRETVPGERRVALVPDVAQRLIKQGHRVLVEAGAGEAAFASDEAYREAGAEIVSASEAWGAECVMTVQPPGDEATAKLRQGQVVIGFLEPLTGPERMQRLAERGVAAISMELVPRISRAQKMDALSAMAAVAGYKAVLIAAERLPRFFPLMTTAAGTVRPATVIVLGAGVAGLQAIATARRLGARVSAYDIREAAREEVQSLGASFIELELEVADMQDAGGYAKALMAEKARQQTELLVPHLAKADVIITTAQIPGRAAPTLVNAAALDAMPAGALVIDLAAASGGNCVATRPGEAVQHGGVTVLGPTNLPATVPAHASQMLARTLMAMVEAIVDEDAAFAPDFEDAVFAGACVTHGGELVHERVKAVLAR